jgi:phage terminase large subunit GpA-like protein
MVLSLVPKHIMSRKENIAITDLNDNDYFSEDDSMWSISSSSSESLSSIVFPSELSRDLFSIEEDESTQNESEWAPNQYFERHTSRSSSNHHKLRPSTPPVLSASFGVLPVSITPTHAP